MILKIRRFSPFLHTAKCGHLTKKVGDIVAFGETITTELAVNKDGRIELCHNCIAKMAIRCAWCAKSIFIGEPITLLSPMHPELFELPLGGVVYSDNPLLQVVGCLRWECAVSGADRAGFWLPDTNGKGHVVRVPTAYEMIMNAKEPSMVVISNTGDMNEAMNPKIIPIKKP